MGYRFQHPFPIISGRRVDFLESGVSTSMGRRGVWSTTKPLSGTGGTDGLPGEGLSYAIVEQSHKPARALGFVLLTLVLAALAFVVAAQG